MTQNNDIFRDSLLIFLDYIKRKLKENPHYEFHPLIKAMMNALESIGQVKPGEHVGGLSGETKNGNFHNPYVVVIEKKSQGIEIKEIRELTTNKQIPLDVMITTFRLQMQLDKIPGKYTTSLQSTNILNKVLPEYHFYSLGDKWKEARDLFAEKLKEGKISLPASLKTDDLIKEFTKIKYDTPWEDYSPRVRSFIAGSSAEIFDSRSNTIIMSSPLDAKVPKYKIFEFASQILMGAGAKYMGDENCVFCKKKNVEDNILSIWDKFVILADKFPLRYGHILVISKKHVKAIGDLPPEDILELEQITENITRFYESRKEKFVVFEPGFAGQTIYHAHIHFLPGDLFIEEVIKSYEMAFEEIQSFPDLIEKYKKHGRYLLWGDGKKMFIAFPKGSLQSGSFFRTLVAGQLLKSDLIDWTKLVDDKNFLVASGDEIKRLKKEWSEFRERT